MFRVKVLFVFVVTFCSCVFAGEKVVLLNDTSAWYHWGCTGTSTALKEGIQSLGYEVDAVSHKMVSQLKEVPSFEEFTNHEKLERFCKTNSEIVTAIQRAEIVVINGEGTIHGIRPNPRALLYLAHISKENFRKHVEIINHSVYPKDDPCLSNKFKGICGLERDGEAQAIYRSVYSKVDFVAIREPLSREEMSKIGITSVLSFDCLPLYIRNHYRNTKKADEKTLLVAGSVAFSTEGAEKLCRYLEAMSERDFKIKVLIGAAAFPAKDDQEFVEFLRGNCGAPYELINASSIEEWLDEINHATFLVSGRFHHSIAAFCLNTPFIALNSNTHKVHALCSFLDQPEPLLYSDPQLLDQLLSKTREILASSTVNNEVKVAEICLLADKNFSGLKAISDYKKNTIELF